MNRSVIAIIPARFGSSRFPGKPLAIINGQTLIQRTLISTSKSPLVERIIVATDDERIAVHVGALGFEAIITSPYCRSGTDRVAEVASLLSDEIDDNAIIVNIQGDWPCIEEAVIEGAIVALRRDREAFIGTVATPIRRYDELHRPSSVKCVLDQRGRALYFSRSPIPYAADLPLEGEIPSGSPYLKHIGIYAYRREALLDFTARARAPLELLEDLEQLRALESGLPINVTLAASMALSVDTPDDINKVECALCSLNISSLQEASSPHLARV